jgi:hypothetical protein
MASGAEVGMPQVCGGNAGAGELYKNRLLKVEIYMSRTTGLIDSFVRGKLALEWFGTGVVDFITAPANPWPDGGEHGLRPDTKFLKQALDSYRQDSRRDPLSSRVHNAYGRHAWSGEDDGEAIRSDNRQGKMGTIGDQAISRRSSHPLGIIGLAQDDDSIAMNLPQRHKVTGIDADCPTEPGPIPLDTRAVITASKA